ncbi:MAG: hypothetical protein JXL81_08835 [Deltaproteobacteria bacterium]|nr:hypothetical protein [Deltaproteobacteria bacterium]
MAFLLTKYIELLMQFVVKGYSLGPVRRYFEDFSPPFVFLRHDVDRFPARAIKMARMEAQAGFQATYYFRCTKKSVFPKDTIGKIKALGHEIGYHYETMVLCKGDRIRAINLFAKNLNRLREVADINTVTAHGSPLSPYTSIGLISKNDAKSFQIYGDPHEQIDYSKVLYITDTGGIFGSRFNRRDWSPGKNFRTPTSPEALAGLLAPDSEPMILLNTHPEKWPGGFFGLIHAKSIDVISNLLKMTKDILDESGHRRH